MTAELVVRLRHWSRVDDADIGHEAAEMIERLDADAANERAEAQSWKAVAHDHSERLKVLAAELVDLRADAVETVQHWGAYAGEYFQQKHNLAGDIERLKGKK